MFKRRGEALTHRRDFVRSVAAELSEHATEADAMVKLAIVLLFSNRGLRGQLLLSDAHTHAHAGSFGLNMRFRQSERKATDARDAFV